MYLDSGIIVKLLAREPESDFFDDALSGQVLDSSELCLPEVRSALLGKERAGFISAKVRNKLMDEFAELCRVQILRLLPLNTEVLERAGSILQACHPSIALRTLDALHVATCDLHRCESMCATDRRIRAASAQMAIKLFPASLDEIAV